jgi:hypothetical protein
MQKDFLMAILVHIKSIYQKKWINFRFIGLLCIAFLLQHLSFATLQNSFGFKNLNSGIAQNRYFEKSSTNQHDGELELFMEDTSEDEDEVHNEQIVYSRFFCGKQSFNVLHYNASINTLYLRLASTNQHKVDLPFFILFHSWKSDLA